jgi:hypothetical protein
MRWGQTQYYVAGLVFERHFTIVPLFCNGNEPIVPNTGVGSLSPTISTVIQLRRGLE